MSERTIERPQLVDWQLEREAAAFLHHEAQLLDDRDFTGWLALLHDDLTYRIPVRATRPEGQEPELGEQMLHFDDTKATLAMRVDRLNSGDAWAEVPPSRTRHYVTNVRVADGPAEGTLAVRSNVLLVRTRGDEATYQTLTGERRDVLARAGDWWTLRERIVLLDVSTLPTYNLAFFL